MTHFVRQSRHKRICTLYIKVLVIFFKCLSFKTLLWQLNICSITPKFIYMIVLMQLHFLLGLGRIPDIEIIRPVNVIHYCWIFSLALKKLSGWISDKLVFYIKQNWHYSAGYLANRISDPTVLLTDLIILVLYLYHKLIISIEY